MTFKALYMSLRTADTVKKKDILVSEKKLQKMR